MPQGLTVIGDDIFVAGYRSTDQQQERGPAQGAAVDREGRLWITRHGARFGALLRLDEVTGQVLATYPMPAGIEDISFDSAGALWAVSEAGSQRWNTWQTFFPLVFRLDVGKLRE